MSTRVIPLSFVNFHFPNYMKSLFELVQNVESQNLNVITLTLGSRPRRGLVRLRGQEGSLGVTSHASGIAKECERMNLPTPK
jgi:hypothetical protein